MLRSSVILSTRSLPDLEPGQVASLAEVTRAMLGVLMAPLTGRRDARGVMLRPALLARCERLVMQHIAAASLGPIALARLSGIPRTTLYRLFEAHGGTVSCIQRERLRRVAAALGDPADERNISQIAAAYGFFDSSAFSRLFRVRYGTTPTEFRRAAAAAPLPGRAGPLDAPAENLAGFLHSLRSEV
jgi:AraC-like DNA-binding protein